MKGKYDFGAAKTFQKILFIAAG